MVLDIAIVIFIIVLVVGIIIYSVKKRYNSQWEGNLIDKRIIETRKQASNSEFGGGSIRTNYAYELIFQTDGGSKINLKVAQSLYDSAVVGTRFVKLKGQYNPQIVTEQQNTNIMNDNHEPPSSAL